ncbi:unnamed protein product [Linum tenue]|uniref:Uncharacterized protein n=1 Tax=Linum tenue TaxID=586396 RepID=A0AAV0L6E2_9ROSI|nr:unnamed protein product [Linum tenue]
MSPPANKPSLSNSKTNLMAPTHLFSNSSNFQSKWRVPGSRFFPLRFVNIMNEEARRVKGFPRIQDDLFR